MIATGCVEQHAEHRYGSRLPTLAWVLTSRSWLRVPIHAFAIEHTQGLVLFDTGLDPAIVSDPDYITSALGRWLLQRIFKLHIGPADALAKQLDAAGLAAAEVRKVVVSHLHFDHIGGIGDVPQAELLVSKPEWAQLLRPHPEREWILRDHIELPGARWLPYRMTPVEDPLLTAFAMSYDVMGDGSLTILPTPGHTPGSISLLVRSAGLPPILLVGDLSYEEQRLMEDRVPGLGDAAALRESYAKVRALKAALPDLLIVPSHDAGAAAALTDISA